MLYPSLQKTIDRLAEETPAIASGRKVPLDRLTAALQHRLKDHAVRLQFICTHNSRRSVLAQVWAQALAYYFHLDHIACYSGGTFASAVYPTVIETLKDQGFRIKKLTGNGNPQYAVHMGPSLPPLIIWSKTFNDPANPDSFVAVMTCSEADENCPYIPAAEARISLPYDDPKISDGLPDEKGRYLERSEQIGAEWHYVLKQLVK